MEHVSQHVEAIRSTIRAKTEVSAEVFDDKVRPMGHVIAANGIITVSLEYVPGMVSQDATRAFLSEAIALSIGACFDKCPEAFERER